MDTKKIHIPATLFASLLLLAGCSTNSGDAENKKGELPEDAIMDLYEKVRMLEYRLDALTARPQGDMWASAEAQQRWEAWLKELGDAYPPTAATTTTEATEPVIAEPAGDRQ